MAQKVKTFLEGEVAKDTLLGIGVAIPGIIDQKERIVLKSHALGIENYSLRFLEQALEIPVYFENDANAAMLAEKKQKYPNAIYLSLNHTLGGAFCIDGKPVSYTHLSWDMKQGQMIILQSRLVFRYFF